MQWFVVVEFDANGEEPHIHALVAAPPSLSAVEAERSWHFGRAQVLPTTRRRPSAGTSMDMSVPRGFHRSGQTSRPEGRPCCRTARQIARCFPAQVTSARAYYNVTCAFCFPSDCQPFRQFGEHRAKSDQVETAHVGYLTVTRINNARANKKATAT
jgi:hypothetical protein